MSATKNSVATLQELCAKKKIPAPVYTTIADPELGFICNIEIMNIEQTGNGRSKRDAKQAAAYLALKKLRLDECLDVDVVNNAASNSDLNCRVELPPVDMVMVLRDYCVQNEHPLPRFELVNQFGTPNAPRFTMLCQIASIKRYGTSDTKKDAKQKAALEMFNAVKNPLNTIESELEVVTLNAKAESQQEERYKLFKTYRELVESGEKTELYGVKLEDRHKFFTRFHDDLKNAAFNIIATEYESEKSKAFELLEALSLIAKISKVPSASGREMLFIEIDCTGIDACFAGFEPEIYTEIIHYFQIMLV